MASTLGEKLRQAREELGISISEVAEQTRISRLYLESIENDDYRPLPGGIFNKGFVKSYAKYIGFDEQEALQEYARLTAANDNQPEEIGPRTYRPEVLTDDRANESIGSTLLFAGVILALLVTGVLFVNYLRNRDTGPQVAVNTSNTDDVVDEEPVANTNSAPPTTSAPAFASSRFEFRTSSEPVSLRSVVDGRVADTLVSPDRPAVFEPKQSIKLSYARSLAQVASLSINGKNIELPSEPANPKRIAIELDINRDNLEEIWRSGRFSYDQAATVQSPTPQAQTREPRSTPAPTRRQATPAPTSAPTREPDARPSPN